MIFPLYKGQDAVEEKLSLNSKEAEPEMQAAKQRGELC